MIAHFLPCPKRPAEWAWQKGKRPMSESSPKSNCPSSIKWNGKVQSVWTSAENETGAADSSMNCLRTHMHQGDKPLFGLVWFKKQSHDDKNKNLRYAYCIMQFFSQKLEFKIKKRNIYCISSERGIQPISTPLDFSPLSPGGKEEETKLPLSSFPLSYPNWIFMHNTNSVYCPRSVLNFLLPFPRDFRFPECGK